MTKGDFERLATNKEQKTEDSTLCATCAEFGEYNEDGGEQGYNECRHPEEPPHPWVPE